MDCTVLHANLSVCSRDIYALMKAKYADAGDETSRSDAHEHTREWRKHLNLFEKERERMEE